MMTQPQATRILDAIYEAVDLRKRRSHEPPEEGVTFQADTNFMEAMNEVFSLEYGAGMPDFQKPAKAAVTPWGPKGGGGS